MLKEELYQLIKQVNKDAYVVVTWSDKGENHIMKHRITDVKVSLINNTLELIIDDD